MHLSPEDERHFERLRAALDIGRGFEIFFCGFQTPAALDEVRSRLAASPPEGNDFEALILDIPDPLLALPERLAAITSARAGRKIIFVSADGRMEDLKGAWAKALQRLNERRNITMRDCPNAVILAGPSWLPWLAHDTAPDLWSVRTAIFSFSSPSPVVGETFSSALEAWPSGLPMPHELEPPEYYEDLASALEGSRRPGEQATRGDLLVCALFAWRVRGEYDPALCAARKAGEAFAAAGEEAMLAASKTCIAAILQQHGETDESLRILREEVLPNYERLVGEKGHALAMGMIAHILSESGGLDEALHILREEVLPVYERLTDVRSKATVMNRIAGVLQQRGDINEALRILREEALPVFERLGDVRERAVTMRQIADILKQQGKLDEALCILREEALPVFERLGDVSSKAITMNKIADMLQQRGEFDEALRIQIEECLPVAEKIGDINDIATVRLSCALLRLQRGGWEHGEAQTILDELTESLELNKKLQQANGIAVSGALLGKVLNIKGQSDKALEVLDESAMACDKLGWTEKAAEVRELQKKIRDENKGSA